MSGLIERIEAAGEGSRELDAAIFWHVENARAQKVYWNAATGLPHKIEGPMPRGLGAVAVEAFAPAYTSSLDAAMTLIPERVEVIFGWRQTVWTKPWARVGAWIGDDQTAATPALALCLAALRARLPTPSIKGDAS